MSAPASPNQSASASPAPAGDVKPEENAQSTNNSISIKVTDNSTELFFRLRMNTPLGKVMEGFCKRTGKDIKSLRFLFDGQRVSAQDTAEELGMGDSDVIEALNQQVGGC